jgi:DNA polymerase theta
MPVYCCQRFLFNVLVVASSLSPEEGCILYSELQKGKCVICFFGSLFHDCINFVFYLASLNQKSISLNTHFILLAMRRYVLSTDLCSIYHVTPIHLNHDPDWAAYYRLFGSLDQISHEVAYVVGVDDQYLSQAAQGYRPQRTEAQQKRALVHRRFHAALMLDDLIHEVPFNTIIQKYQVNRGTLQTLQITAAAYAGMVTIFCEKLKWTNLHLLLSQFQNRLEFGVQSDLIELCRVPDMKAHEARILLDSGIKDIESLACSSADTIARIIRSARPFQSKAVMVDEQLIRRSEDRFARKLVDGARRLAAEMIRVRRNVAPEQSVISQSTLDNGTQLAVCSPHALPVNFEVGQLDELVIKFTT